MGSSKRLTIADLPPVQGVFGPHVPTMSVGELLFFSGVLPLEDGQVRSPGKVGREVTLEEAQECGKLCALQLLARAVDHLGDPQRIVAIPKLTVFVNCEPTFRRQSEVANAVSEVLEGILGSAGTHTRSAIGVASLPKGAAVEVEAVMRISAVNE